MFDFLLKKIIYQNLFKNLIKQLNVILVVMIKLRW